MRMSITLGLHAVLRREVAESDTAHAVGSGDMPLLATPRLLAWCETATVAALHPELKPEVTSVGTRVEFEHSRPSPVGSQLSVRAELAHVDGRLVRFEVVAHDEEGMIVGHGQVTRVLVDRARFLDRVPPVGPQPEPA
jgi:predicted thioesterase